MLSLAEDHSLVVVDGRLGIEILHRVWGRPEPRVNSCLLVVLLEVETTKAVLLDLELLESAVDHAQGHLQRVLDPLVLLVLGLQVYWLSRLLSVWLLSCLLFELCLHLMHLYEYVKIYFYEL